MRYQSLYSWGHGEFETGLLFDILAVCPFCYCYGIIVIVTFIVIVIVTALRKTLISDELFYLCFHYLKILYRCGTDSKRKKNLN